MCGYYMCGYSALGIATHGIATRATLGVYAPRHEETWSTQTHNEIYYNFIVVPYVSTNVKISYN